MKVAYVTVQFPVPSETFAIRDIMSLQRFGVDITVYAISRKIGKTDADNKIKTKHAEMSAQRIYEAIMWCGVFNVCRTIYTIVNERKISTSKKIAYLLSIAGAAQSAKYISDDNPDIIHIFWGHYPSLVAYLIKKKLPTAKVSLFLGAYDMYRAGAITREVGKSSSVVFTHAAANVGLVKQLTGRDDIRVIRRGIELGKYDPLSTKGNIVDPNLVLTVGRLIKEKGVSTVLGLFADVLKLNPSARIEIIGDGPERAALESQARHAGIDAKVKFRGHISQDLVRKAMMQAKVVMLLSEKKGERLPNVIKEAMASGAICISSRTPGIEELIDDGVDGYIVEPNQRSLILDLMSRHLGRSEIEPMQKLARLKIEREFNVDDKMAQYIDAWTETPTQPQ